MDLSKTKEALEKIFFEENERIVFWNDPENEFKSLIEELKIDKVKFIDLENASALETKIAIECGDSSQKFLLYAAQEEPSFANDWLLDIRLYSRSFRADRASVVLSELKLENLLLREHLSTRRKFFDNKDRFQRLKDLVKPDDKANDIDRKMLAIITRSSTDEISNILRTIYHNYTSEEHTDLSNSPPIWSEIEKFDLDDAFWSMIENQYGYDEEKPTLRNLLYKMLATDFSYHYKGDLPESISNLLLNKSGHRNAVICLAHWRDSNKKSSSYNQLSDVVGKTLNIDTVLGSIKIDDVVNVFTFSELERVIVLSLMSAISKFGTDEGVERIRDLVKRRQAGHWCASYSVKENIRNARFAVYEAVLLAAEVLFHKSRTGEQFDQESDEKQYKAYVETHYLFDQLYRQFCEYAEIAHREGLEWLLPIKKVVEDIYQNWFIQNLSLAWNKRLQNGLLNNWKIGSVTNQYNFFESQVRPFLRGSQIRRVFVIISDALRYEVADELAKLLNGNDRVEAQLESMLGVLPSYTKLGMASLLPHSGSMKYQANGTVQVKDVSSEGFSNRNTILDRNYGIAFKCKSGDPDDIRQQSKEEAARELKDKRAVYIYHNVIDATGDKAETENRTFIACRQAINELNDLVKFLINNRNANNILITADHGFLYSEAAVTESDRSRLNSKPEGTVLAKKRYLIGKNLPENDEVWLGNTNVTAKTQEGMEFWVPKGCSKFHFVGGAKFVHGGAMPQEVVVPLINIKHKKDKDGREKARVRFAAVQVVGNSHKITTKTHRFNLIQMEPVTEKVRPVTLKIAIYDSSIPVTDIATATFDSQSNNFDERQKSVLLTLLDGEFDRSKRYRLSLRDMDNIEVQGIDVTIDRMIADDF